MFKNDVLQIIFAYAVKNGLCSNKKSFARLIGISESNYTKVFADTNERFCTTNVLLKANAALGNVFSAQWLLTGEGEMYANNSNNVPAPTPTHVHKTITPSYDDDDLEYLRKRVKELEYLVDLQKKRIEQLESEAKKGYASVSVS